MEEIDVKLKIENFVATVPVYMGPTSMYVNYDIVTDRMGYRGISYSVLKKFVDKEIEHIKQQEKKYYDDIHELLSSARDIDFEALGVDEKIRNLSSEKLVEKLKKIEFDLAIPNLDQLEKTIRLQKNLYDDVSKLFHNFFIVLYCTFKLESCSICLSKPTLNNLRTLECGHNFHKDCLGEWSKSKTKCPLCRRKF